jgi:nicotinic acid phosphoribosyltransferase
MAVHRRFALIVVLSYFVAPVTAGLIATRKLRGGLTAFLWGGALREKILHRNGTLIIRPDSGDAVTVLEELFKIVSEVFGYEVNRKGWKTTVPVVRFIQGDGVNFYTIQNITGQLTRRGWSQDIWSYGMGGALLQQVNRDTLKFALKCSAIDRNGMANLQKSQNRSSKASKGSRFNLVHNGKDFATVEVLEGGRCRKARPSVRSARNRARRWHGAARSNARRSSRHRHQLRYHAQAQ